MRGRAPFFGTALFLCPADPARQVDSRIPACDPAAGIAPPASTSARTQPASCPRKSRCVTLPCELLWRIPVSEPTLRSCRGSVDTAACDPAPVSVPQTSLAQALDVRLACGFVPCLTSMLRSIRGGGASRPARRGRILGNVATPHLNTADFRLSANRLSTPGTPRWASSTRASCGACR